MAETPVTTMTIREFLSWRYVYLTYDKTVAMDELPVELVWYWLSGFEHNRHPGWWDDNIGYIRIEEVTGNLDTGGRTIPLGDVRS